MTLIPTTAIMMDMDMKLWLSGAMEANRVTDHLVIGIEAKVRKSYREYIYDSSSGLLTTDSDIYDVKLKPNANWTAIRGSEMSLSQLAHSGYH